MLKNLNIFKNTLANYKVIKLKVKFLSQQHNHLHFVIQNSITKTLLSSGMTRKGSELQLKVNEKIGEFVVDIYTQSQAQNIGSFLFEKDDLQNGTDLVEKTYYYSRIVKADVEGCTIVIDFIFRQNCYPSEHKYELLQSQTLKNYVQGYLKIHQKNAITIYLKEKQLLLKRLKQEQQASKLRVKKGAKRQSSMTAANKLKIKRNTKKKMTNLTDQQNLGSHNNTNHPSQQQIPQIIIKRPQKKNLSYFKMSYEPKYNSRKSRFSKNDRSAINTTENPKISSFGKDKNVKKDEKTKQKIEKMGKKQSINILKFLRRVKYINKYQFSQTNRASIPSTTMDKIDLLCVSMENHKHFQYKMQTIDDQCIVQKQEDLMSQNYNSSEGLGSYAKVLSSRNDNLSRYEIDMNKKRPYNLQYNSKYLINKLSYKQNISEALSGSKKYGETERKKEIIIEKDKVTQKNGIKTCRSLMKTMMKVNERYNIQKKVVR